MLNITDIVLTLKNCSSVVLCFVLGNQQVASNDCITNTTRYSVRHAGLLFVLNLSRTETIQTRDWRLGVHHRSGPISAEWRWQMASSGFTSKGLDSAKRNYAIQDKEWKHVLEGTKHTIEIINDHRNLTYFQMSQDLNHWQACWSLWLARFDSV